MEKTQSDSVDIQLFRKAVCKIVPNAIVTILCIFLIHASIRIGGIWNTLFIPLSMIILWPIPWLLSGKEARYSMGFKSPKSKSWFFLGPFYVLCALAVCAVIVWLIFGYSSDNWMVKHAIYLNEALSQAPPSTSIRSLFLLATIPALIFSPFAEEFLFRAYMISGFFKVWGIRSAICIQAFAFALVHLAHYGLNPFQPYLIALWFPSMFFVSVVLGWIVRKSGSIWVAVLSHGFFNLGMNGLVFLLLPEVIGF